MDTLTSWIAAPLGYVMKWCWELCGNYGVAIILFTLLTKIILLPLSVWIQKNSIRMVEIQPELNRIKARFFGAPDTIAEEESKLYKQKHYHPLANLIPLFVQLLLLMGVVAVIYRPLQYIFQMDQATVDSLLSLFPSIDKSASDAQLALIEALRADGTAAGLLAVDLTAVRAFDMSFLGLDLSWNPSVKLGITAIVPVVAGLSSWLLSAAQNASNVLQAEQSKLNKYSMLALSVGLSLYLGFFVPAGIALYWVASNLLAIVQLYALNAVIPPKKYVDYAALEDSRRELAALQSVGGKKKLFRKDPQHKREKADVKRFFGIANKHVVFYSERSGFYKYYKDLIDGLLARTNLSIHYITNDPEDAIFALAEKQPRIKPYYVGVKKLIPMMMRMEADIVVMTTPELDNSYIKRSLMQKDIEYIFVPHDASSCHMSFKEHAFDHFDTIYCVGPHIAQEMRATEQVYGTKEKTMVEFGYPLIEDLIAAHEAQGADAAAPGRRRQILIGPSWQEDNLLDSCIDTLIDRLYGDDVHIIVRPHPEYMKRFRPKMDALVEKYRDKIGDGLTFELDFSSNTSTYASDLLITDWSGIGLEFCFATLKPALFINTKMKMENPNYEKIGLEPREIWLRSRIGAALDKNEVDRAGEVARALLQDGERYRDTIRQIREEYFYHLGSHGAAGVRHIIDSLSARARAKAAEKG